MSKRNEGDLALGEPEVLTQKRARVPTPLQMRQEAGRF